MMWLVALILTGVPCAVFAAKWRDDAYYDKYNERYEDAKRRGTVGKFRGTQFPY